MIGKRERMVSEILTVTNSVGLHLRPAAVFAEAMQQFECKVTILFNEREINAKSVINIMAAGIGCGAEIEVQCEGSDEKEALKKAAELIYGGLEE